MKLSAKTAPNKPLEATSFARAEQVSDDRHHEWEERAGAESLNGAEGDELVHVLRRT
jgi:hypothetical protein